MRNLFWRFIIILVLAWSFGLVSQVAGQGGPQQPGTTKSKDVAGYSSHDLSGRWGTALSVPRFATSGPAARGGGDDPKAAPYQTLSYPAPPMTPWAQAKYDKAKPQYNPGFYFPGGPPGAAHLSDSDDPKLRCVPSVLPRLLIGGVTIVQTSQSTFMLYEDAWREILTDGREHTKNLAQTLEAAVIPSFMGESIGKWEGDTFVVDTIGFNQTEENWLDAFGHPHSDQMHVVERWRRVDADTLTLQFSVEDPKAYTRPWESTPRTFKRSTARPLGENHCIYEEQRSFIDAVSK